MTSRLPATTITSSTYTRRCALNPAPRPPPLRGGYLIFAISGKAATRSGLVRCVSAPKTDANHSDRDAMKTTPIRCFFGEFLQGEGLVSGKVQHLQTRQKIAFFSFNFNGFICGKKVQYFAIKSAIFSNLLFLIRWKSGLCGKKKCNHIALILHFYCTLLLCVSP